MRRLFIGEDAARLDAKWLWARAESCLLAAQECDRLAETWWAGFTLWRFRWRRQAVWWRVEQLDLSRLAEQMEAQE